MTKRQFYDWQTAGGADDVMRLVDAHPELWSELSGAIQRQIEAPS